MQKLTKMRSRNPGGRALPGTTWEEEEEEILFCLTNKDNNKKVNN